MDHNANIAVVGAGPGGLAAAVLLAAKGVGVTVYEAQDQIGGRTSRIDLDGYAFDRGPTFFLMPHVLQEIFQAAGRDLHEEVRLVPLDPMYRLVIGQENGPDTTIDTTQDLAEMARPALAHPPAGRRELRPFRPTQPRQARRVRAHPPTLDPIGSRPCTPGRAEGGAADQAVAHRRFAQRQVLRAPRLAHRRRFPE